MRQIFSCSSLATAFILLTWLPCNQAAGQTIPQGSVLSIEAPNPTQIVVSITYFDAQQPTSATVERLKLNDEHQLKLTAAQAVDIQIASLGPLSLKLVLDAGLERVEAAGDGSKRNLRLQAGNIPANWRAELLDVRPTAADASVIKVWESFLATQTIKTESISLDAQFDRPSLQAFAQVLGNELGKFQTDAPRQWMAWNVGSDRFLSADCIFENGSVTFELAAAEDSLWDIQLESERLEHVWFSGPSSTDEYEKLATELVRELFAGKTASAWTLFDPTYRESITVEKLESVALSLEKEFGALKEIKPKLTRLLGAPIGSDQQPIVVVLAMDAEGGSRAVAEVRFVFNVSPTQIPKGKLASFFVRPTWKTADGARQAVGEKFLASALDNTAWELPADLGTIPIDRTQWQANYKRLCDDLGGAGETDWDLWRFARSGQFSRAQGTVRLPSGERADLQLDFADNSIVGATLVKKFAAVTTLSSVNNPIAYSEAAESFWKSLLSDDFAGGLAQLSVPLQTTQSLDDLRFSVATSGFSSIKKFEQRHVRLSTQLSRPGNDVVSVFSIAQLGDGTLQPLRCDLQLVDGNMEVVTYETSINDGFPVDPTPASNNILSAFLRGDRGAIKAFVAAEQRIELDEDILVRFLAKLNRELGNSRPSQLRLMYRYAGGQRNEELSGTLKLGEQESAFSILTKLGKLQSFQFDQPSVADFLEKAFVTSRVQQAAIVFVRAWFTTPVQRDDLLRKTLNAELSTEASLDSFGSLRQYLLQRYGAYSSVVVSSVTAEMGDHVATAICRVETATDAYDLELTFVWTATSMRITAVEVLR